MKIQPATMVYNAAAQLGEGPVWDAASSTLYFVDIKGCAVHAYRPDSGGARRYAFDDYMCWLAPRRDGDGFIAGTRRGLVRAWFDDEARIVPLPVVLGLPPGVRLNDAKVHPDGSLWFGSMHNADPQRPDGQLFRLAPNFALSEQDRGIHICNGPAFSADGRHMFHNDSLLRRTFSYDIADGVAGPARQWRSFSEQEGSPDGMCFDSEGGLWIACWGSACVRRYRPDGSCDHVVTLPTSQASSLAFGGPDLCTLFITTAAEGMQGCEQAGNLFAVRVSIPGLPPAAFG
jgi:D-xylonolactonase